MVYLSYETAATGGALCRAAAQPPAAAAAGTQHAVTKIISPHLVSHVWLSPSHSSSENRNFAPF